MKKKELRSTVPTALRRRLGDLDGDGKVGLSDAKAALGSMGRKLSSATKVATEATRNAAQSVATGTKSTAAAGKHALVQAGHATAKAGRAVSRVAAETGHVVARSGETVGTTLLDHNNDGKVDQQDLKIMTEKTLEFTKRTADELASSATVKDALKAAAAGAAIGVPVPIIGPAGGAAVAVTGYLVVKGAKEVAEAVGTARSGRLPKAMATSKKPKRPGAKS